MLNPPDEVTELLRDWSQGDASALDRLIPLVFEDLRHIAGRLFRGENEAHTLQPTALVNEVYLRLIGQRKVQWQNRDQFFAVAALLMRRILVDYAKGRQTAKRGSGAVKLPLDEAVGIAPVGEGLDLEALDEALSRLAEIDPRQSRIVELRFFVGLSHEEIAELMKISVITVKREWKTARLWLYRELANKEESRSSIISRV
jgi:RNA polymerase sigma factor (TIGR02999 family)